MTSQERVDALTGQLREVSQELLRQPERVERAERLVAEAERDLATAKDELKTKEAMAAEEALQEDGLTNDTKRKQAVDKGLRDDLVVKEWRAKVADLQGKLRNAEIALKRTQADGTALRYRLEALGTSGLNNASQNLLLAAETFAKGVTRK